MAPSINNTSTSTFTTPSSTLVNISEHAELRLIALLASTATSSTFRADCESCIANAEAARLIRTIGRDDGAVEGLFRFKTLSLHDAVSAFFLWAALLDRVDVKEQGRVAEEMADAVIKCGVGSGGSGNKVDPRRRRRVVAMLCALYNLRTDATDKCRLLERIVRQNSGSATNEQPQLVHDAERALERWDEDGVVPTQDRRNLLRALADSCNSDSSGGGTDDKQQQQRKQRFLLRLVRTYKDERECRTKEALTMATQAAEGAICDPVTLFAEQRGMLRMPAIVALKDKSAPLYNLLRIFQEAKLAEFQTYLTKNPKALSSLNNNNNTTTLTTEEDCVRHMRILSLCSLAAEYGDEIPYDAVAQTLNIAESDVESWVIAAVASGLLSAKMDQLQRVVMVERSVVRNFGPAQWRTMQAKIHAWKKNVKLVLDGLEQQAKEGQLQLE